MMFRQTTVQEAAERYPTETVVLDASNPNAKTMAKSNRRALQLRTAFENGANWSSQMMQIKVTSNFPLAMFNDEASQEATAHYFVATPNITEGHLVGLRMAFRAGASWARAYHQGAADAQRMEQPEVEDTPDNVIELYLAIGDV